MYKIKRLFNTIKQAVDSMTYQSTAVIPSDFEYDLVVSCNSITFEMSVKDQDYYSCMFVNKDTTTDYLVHCISESLEIFKMHLMKCGIINNLSHADAFDLLMSGDKITHRCFSHGEYIWVDPEHGEIVTQNNEYYFSAFRSMSLDINYKTGWSIYPKRFS